MNAVLSPARLSFPALLVAAGILVFAGMSFALDRVALVIGNDAYENVPALSQAKNDANTIGQALESIGFEVETLLDATWKETHATIERFAVDNADAALAVVYFAGHGVEVKGEHYLIPVDSNPTSESSFDYEAIPLGFLLTQLADHQNCLRVVILDACRNNPFAQTNRSLGSARGLGARTKPSPKQTLIAYSAGTGQEAVDGMYTPALLKHLKNPHLRGEEVFYAISNEVSEMTNGGQEPAMYIIGGRPFSFHLDSGSTTPSPTTPSSPGPETPATSKTSKTSTQPTRPAPQTPPPPIATKAEIQSFLDSWVASWESLDIQLYSAHYGNYFAGNKYSNVTGEESLTRRAWMVDKEARFRDARSINVDYSDASFEFDDETVILKFRQKYAADYRSRGPYDDDGTKILLLRQEDGELKIVNEKFFPPNVRHNYFSSTDSGLYSVISSFINDWADAWESRNLDRYSRFYDRSFQGKKGSSYLGYDAWMNDMAGKFRKASSISIGLGELDIHQKGDRYTVEYRQTYKASNYSDVGWKNLVLIKDSEGNLKIVGESWRSL